MDDPQPASAQLSLTVNGRVERVHAHGRDTLLQVLREQLGLTSVREGCGVGMCGSCTVLVDGKVVSSCLYPAPLAQGHEIVTVEGIQSGAELHPIQRAFLERSAFQCSACTPGFVLTVKALLDENPTPSDDEIREYLAGNLCRCGSYLEIIEAVRMAAGQA